MTTLYHFHVNLFAAPPAELFGVTWEDAARRLERLPRMIFEPDGSFVISGERAASSQASRVVPDPDRSANRWQVDGHLFDFAGRLHRVELHGHAPADAFDELLRCFGWPEQAVLFEMVRQGERFDEAEFRHRAVQ